MTTSTTQQEALMFVVVHHQVKDPDYFFADIPSVAKNAPPGVHPRQFCPARDKASAVCLWQAESVDAVRAYLDETTGPSAVNTYLEVDESASIGLPTAAAAI
jgi:hypothetical protein